jgi:hypothetical protein
MEFERTIPGTELFLRELVDTASLLDRDPTATHGSDHRGLAADDPPRGVRTWQLLHEPCPAYQLTRGRFHQAAPSSAGSSVGRGPARDRTGRKDSCMLAGSLFYDPASCSGAIPVRFTIFSRLRACCHQFFRLFESGATLRKYRCLKTGPDQRAQDRSVAQRLCRNGSGRRQITISRFFSRSGDSFFTFGSLRRPEFYPRLTRAILPLLNRGGTR